MQLMVMAIYSNCSHQKTKVYVHRCLNDYLLHYTCPDKLVPILETPSFIYLPKGSDIIVNPSPSIESMHGRSNFFYSVDWKDQNKQTKKEMREMAVDYFSALQIAQK